MLRIPIMKTKFPSQAYIQTRGPKVGNIRRFRYEPGRDGYMHLMKGPDNLWWETKYEPLQGPELPRDVEKYRQQMIDAMESGNTRRILSRTRAYEDAIAQERARQAYNQKLIEEAVRLRKEELWRQYMEEEDPPPGIGWPTGKGEELDEGFEEQARWDVQGMVNPNDNFWRITDDEFREKYKDAPWRLW